MLNDGMTIIVFFIIAFTLYLQLLYIKSVHDIIPASRSLDITEKQLILNAILTLCLANKYGKDDPECCLRIIKKLEIDTETFMNALQKEK